MSKIVNEVHFDNVREAIMQGKMFDDETEEMLSMISMNNLNPGVSHPRDRDRAIDTFRDLYKRGQLPDPILIERWALQRGWISSEARDLRNIAQAVSEGKKLRKASL